MNKLTFELGERRRVTLKVWINGATDFLLEKPTWELKTGAVEASGTCESEKDGGAWLLTAEVQPKARRTYQLQFTFSIATEIFKKTIQINVV